MGDKATRINDSTLQFVRVLPGPIEKVCDYLTDAKKRGEWFASGPLPAKVGERFEMRFKHSDLSPVQATPPEQYVEMDKNGHTSSNVLLAFEPPHRLAFTFGGEKNPANVSEVEFRLIEEGDKVRLTLTHSKIPTDDYADGVSVGWHSHLDILQSRTEGTTPPALRDVWRDARKIYDKP
jgi:uncharacterized protein YndB with AHSA1/START domain